MIKLYSLYSEYDDVITDLLLDSFYLDYRTHKMNSNHGLVIWTRTVENLEYPKILGQVLLWVRQKKITVDDVADYFASLFLEENILKSVGLLKEEENILKSVGLLKEQENILKSIGLLKEQENILKSVVKSLSSNITTSFNHENILSFKSHFIKYLLMYNEKAGYEICRSFRYKSSNKIESCIIASTEWKSGDEMKFCNGVMTKLTEAEEQALANDFSIVFSTKRQSNCLFLGPARFMNHDCNPNCKFMPVGDNISFKIIRPVKPGEELTVYYADGYFGTNNSECMCSSCEETNQGAFRIFDMETLKNGEDRTRRANQIKTTEKYVLQNIYENMLTKDEKSGPKCKNLNCKETEQLDGENGLCARCHRHLNIFNLDWPERTNPQKRRRTDSAETEDAVELRKKKQREAQTRKWNDDIMHIFAVPDEMLLRSLKRSEETDSSFFVGKPQNAKPKPRGNRKMVIKKERLKEEKPDVKSKKSKKGIKKTSTAVKKEDDLVSRQMLRKMLNSPKPYPIWTYPCGTGSDKSIWWPALIIPRIEWPDEFLAGSSKPTFVVAFFEGLEDTDENGNVTLEPFYSDRGFITSLRLFIEGNDRYKRAMNSPNNRNFRFFQDMLKYVKTGEFDERLKWEKWGLSEKIHNTLKMQSDRPVPVWVDPTDGTDLWWPALIVPNEEIDDELTKEENEYCVAYFGGKSEESSPSDEDNAQSGEESKNCQLINFVGLHEFEIVEKDNERYKKALSNPNHELYPHVLAMIKFMETGEFDDDLKWDKWGTAKKIVELPLNSELVESHVDQLESNESFNNPEKLVDEQGAVDAAKISDLPKNSAEFSNHEPNNVNQMNLVPPPDKSSESENMNNLNMVQAVKKAKGRPRGRKPKTDNTKPVSENANTPKINEIKTGEENEATEMILESNLKPLVNDTSKLAIAPTINSHTHEQDVDQNNNDDLKSPLIDITESSTNVGNNSCQSEFDSSSSKRIKNPSDLVDNVREPSILKGNKKNVAKTKLEVGAVSNSKRMQNRK